MEYFKFSELCKSDIATKNGISNYPKSADVITNLYNLMEILNPMRKKWGSAILITSAYRCELLNKLVGGSENSGHKFGNAVDLVPSNGKVIELFEFMKDFLIDNEIEFDELLLEDGWIHFSLKSWNNEHRKKILILQN